MKAAFTPGTTFAGYRVHSLIGRGGMGVVYLATDLSLERPVALKLIAPELAEDEHFRSRFLREPRLAASLDHPNVIPIYEAGERDGRLYLAMRYVEGSDLKTLVERDGKLSPEGALRVLAQVAGALDSAHRRGLVHRDVKPANVLLDEDGHVYLTDFGITKQIGGASTDTGRLVGTLDYLAPEQIRGEQVDGRTDCYALACVLYECLAGAPPFRRTTEGETLWAHMQEEPAPLPGQPALDPVLRKGLAKDRGERYGTCAELIEGAAEALGLGVPRVTRRPLVPPALRGKGRLVLAAGLLLLGAAIAAAIVALTSGGGSQIEPLGNGVAAIDPARGGVASLTESTTTPGNVAVGERAVWVINTEDETVSRIDPETKEIVRTFEAGPLPAELAVGAGALWVGHADESEADDNTLNSMGSVSRIDPESGAVTRRLKLPGENLGGDPTAGLPRLAVGAGAVWAINPDGGVSRIDPETGRLVGTVRGTPFVSTIAAGEEGVWFLSFDRPSAVTRIDARANRVAESIRVGAHVLLGIAVGAGSVWATAHEDGLVWRIEPGRSPAQRTIDVGFGATLLDFGEGAVWTGNWIDGSVSRIDPRTNRVTAHTSIGAPQALAAGAGAAWVSVSGGVRDGSLTTSACGEVVSGGEKPDVLIASDLPLRGSDSARGRAMADAIRFVLDRRGFRAGRHSVGYQSCDDTTRQANGIEFRKCAANANAYVHTERLVAVIGPYQSFCATMEIPILNRAPEGPLALISPSNTRPGLTRGGVLAFPAPVGLRGEPDVFYPTGERNFLRVAPRDDLQGVAHAVLAKQLGLKGVYLLDDGNPQWKILFVDSFRRAARRLGVPVAGSAALDPAAKSYDALADRVARSGAQGVLIGGTVFAGGDRLLKALRARLGPGVTIMAGDTFTPIPELVDRAGPAADGVYVSTLDVPLPARELSPAGRRLARDLGATAPFGTPIPWVLQAAGAAEVVLEAIARSDGTRSSVLEEMRGTQMKNGILGSFRFDRHGDITPASIPILRVTGDTTPDPEIHPSFQGAIVDRVVAVPARLSN
jgi:ABC-type branched-subunit amino acid transport system substrate-binding protein/DNA-binding beta-propeller fold protein YncE/predicted Ser/Thr protein kinase